MLRVVLFLIVAVVFIDRIPFFAKLWINKAFFAFSFLLYSGYILSINHRIKLPNNIYIYLYFFSVIFSGFIHTSSENTQEVFTQAMLVILAILSFNLFYERYFDIEDIRQMIIFFSVAGSVFSLFAFFNPVFSQIMGLKGSGFWFQGVKFARLDGIGFDPNFTCLFLTPGLLFSFDSIARRKRKIISVISFFTILTTIFLTFSRGGYLGISVAFIVYAFYIKNKKIIFSLLLLSAAIAGIYSLGFFPKFIEGFINTRVLDFSISSEPRIRMWLYEIKNIKGIELLVGNGMPVYSSLLPSLRLHNTYLDLLKGFGVFSLLFWILMFIKPLFSLWGKSPVIAAISLGILIQVSFLSVLNLKLIWLLWALMMYKSDDRKCSLQTENVRTPKTATMNVINFNARGF